MHRRLGLLGLPLALGVAVTMVPAGMQQVARDTAAGAGDTGISAIVGVFTSAILFFTLVTCGVVARRDREAHARWLLLATLVVAWPAWFRWRHRFPSVPVLTSGSLWYCPICGLAFAHTNTMYWLTVKGLDHMAFTDAALKPTAAERVKVLAGTQVSAQRIQEMTTAYVSAFFGAHLSGAPPAASLTRSPYVEAVLRRKP
ncbi:MAG: hypothetical protein U0132_13570 [Gemmatimonadaceae bacterium]